MNHLLVGVNLAFNYSFVRRETVLTIPHSCVRLHSLFDLKFSANKTAQLSKQSSVAFTFSHVLKHVGSWNSSTEVSGFCLAQLFISLVLGVPLKV